MRFLPINDCSLGLNVDQSPESLQPGMWTDCSNVRFRPGGVERVNGMRDQFTPAVIPYATTFFETTTARYWISAGIAKVYAHTTSATTEITPASDFTGTIDDKWTLSTFSGNLIANNGIEQPMYWNGNTGTDLAVLTGWDSGWRAKVVRPWLDFLVAINITKSGTNYPHMFKTSGASVPGAIPASWDAADETTLAVERQLDETSDKLVDGLAYGDTFIFAKERSLYRCTYTGDLQSLILTQRIPGDHGVMAVDCMTQTPIGIVGLGVGDIWLYDGQGTQSICDSVVRDWFFNAVNPTYRKRCFVVTNPPSNEVLICFPEAGSSTCTLALVWNWNSRKWSKRTLPFATHGAVGLIEDTSASNAWTAMSQAWSDNDAVWVPQTLGLQQTRLMLAKTLPALTAYDFGNTEAGANVASSLERSGLFYTPDVVMFKDVYPVVDAPDGTILSIELGSAMRPGVTPTYQTAVNFTVGTSDRICARTKGRSAALRITNTDGNPWKLLSLAIGTGDGTSKR